MQYDPDVSVFTLLFYIITLQSLYNIIYQKKSELHISFYSISFKENSVYSEVNALSYEQEKQFTSTTFYIKETK